MGIIRSAPVPRMRVAVLLGGPSAEREISLQSGSAVASALEGAGHVVIEIDPERIPVERFDWGGIDVAFIALHGRFGEDGQVQRILEEAGVPYTGSDVAASRLAISKSASKERFLQCGVPTLPYGLIHETDSARHLLDVAGGLGFPVVVKPDAEGSSLGVTIVRSRDALPLALSRCFSYGPFGLIEPFVAGTEWTAGFIDDLALPLIRIETDRGFFDFHAKYEDDATGYRFDDSIADDVRRRIAEAAAAACRAVGTRGTARVDVMLDSDARPWVLEVNTIPGLTDHSLVPKAAARIGIDFTELCERCLQSALTHARRREAA